MDLSNPAYFRERLLSRLDAIGQSLSTTGQVWALIGLGSVGTELDRIDAYSDLDFFVIVKSGRKNHFLENLDWLDVGVFLAYKFRNTVDGFKALYTDGIYCEFAVFELSATPNIPIINGRLVWKDETFDDSILISQSPSIAEDTLERLLGEALTNLYVGLGRLHRGEKLSATRFIQGYAVDRVLELTHHIEVARPIYVDVFGAERRYENRFPVTATLLPQFMQGYDGNIESAKAILTFLVAHFDVNNVIKSAILELCQR